MKQLFSDRLRSARALNGWSLQDLADKMENKISRQALHKYEKAEVFPDSEMISLLAKTLNVRPDYFFNEQKFEFSEVEFRKLKKLPAKEESRIIEDVKDKLARYLELEQIHGISHEFKNPITIHDAFVSFDQIEKASQQIRKSWILGSNPISNVVELLEEKHIKIIHISVNEDLDGMQAWVNKSIPVIAINQQGIKSQDRIRFTVMHELAHLLLPVKSHLEGLKEKLCHQFAAAMLLPAESIFCELGKKRSKLLIQELGLIKKQYGISIRAIVKRALDLDIITKTYHDQFIFYMNQENWVVQEPEEFNYIGSEESSRFDALLYRALAEGIITVSKAATLNNQTIADFRQKLKIVS